MDFGVFDIFRVGIGPSSSHTVGPMRAAANFVDQLVAEGRINAVARVRAEVFGSLALTGYGHATDVALLLGLSGERPEKVDPDEATSIVARIRESGLIRLGGSFPLRFVEAEDLLMHRRETLPGHTNGMRFTAFDASGEPLHSLVCYSTGGGFIATEQELQRRRLPRPPSMSPTPSAPGGKCCRWRSAVALASAP